MTDGTTAMQTGGKAVVLLRRAVFYLLMLVGGGAIMLLLAALAVYQLGYRPLNTEDLDAELKPWASPQSMELRSDALRILSLNLNHAAGSEARDLEHGELFVVSEQNVTGILAALVLLAKEERIDVLLLQGIDFASANTAMLDQAEYLARELKFGYVARARVWKHPFLPFPDPLERRVIGETDTGLAVISRVPLFGAQRFALHQEKLDNWWASTFAPAYGLLKVELAASGKHLFLYNTAFTSGDLLTRERQARETARVIGQTSNGKGILAGTLFAQPVRRKPGEKGRLDCSLDLVRHRLNFAPLFSDSELFRSPEEFVTFTGKDGRNKTYDYVLPEKGVRISEWKILDLPSPLSAHRPILVEVIL